MKKSCNLLETYPHTSEKNVIENLKFQLKQCQITNAKLSEKIELQQFIIDAQSSTMTTQGQIIDFLNNWKFRNTKKQTNLKLTCQN